jgi:hypothetical protein
MKSVYCQFFLYSCETYYLLQEKNVNYKFYAWYPIVMDSLNIVIYHLDNFVAIFFDTFFVKVYVYIAVEVF